MLRAFVGRMALFACILLLSACETTALNGNTSPTPNFIYTSAAKTVAARLTGQANVEIVEQLTRSAITMSAPTETLQPVANTLTPSASPAPPAPIDTPAPPTATRSAVPCNRADLFETWIRKMEPPSCQTPVLPKHGGSRIQEPVNGLKITPGYL